MRLIHWLPAAACLAATASPAFAPARMAQPSALAAGAEILEVRDIGGGVRGRYVAGPFTGSFRRDDTRLAVLDPAVERRAGAVSFDLRGPDINGAIEVDCTFRAQSLNAGPIHLEQEPTRLTCSFQHEGRVIPAALTAQTRREGVAGAFGRETRRGRIALDRTVLTIRSEHRLHGAAIGLAAPAGYVFEANGAPVGSVEITGRPRIRIVAGADPAVRRAVVAGALALGLMWDPATSALGREAG